MAITLKRQINDEEKQVILKRYGRKCFATGHDIPESQPIHFDHIRAFALVHESETDNVAGFMKQSTGDVEKGFAEADHVIKETLRVHRGGSPGRASSG